MTAEENALIAERRAKLKRLRQSGRAYPNDFRRGALAADLQREWRDASREALSEQAPPARVAGRVMLRREFKRAVFLTVQDGSGRIQIYAARDALGDDAFAALQDWDLGDIGGFDGVLFRTQTGELTVRAHSVRMLAKALRPLPEKRRGLTDPGLRHRRRYVSLIVNSEERRVFARRAALVKYLRDFLAAEGYLEAETPMMLPVPGGALARPFATRHNALNRDFYLRVAQELYLKRLIVGGFEKVFELNRNFRNEGVSTRHNPEFTMLEFNAAFADCRDMMAITEQMIRGLCLHLNDGAGKIVYQNEELDFAAPFARKTPAQALRDCDPRYQSADLDDPEYLRAELRRLGKTPPAAADAAVLRFVLFEEAAEKRLRAPTFITALPAAVSPLARRCDDDPTVAERFELFIAGREIANGFSELNDPEIQKEIFEQQARARADGDEEAMRFDADYIRALEYGLPPNAGCGIGVDRLTMLFTDAAGIRDVILFPQMRAAEESD